MITYTKQVVFVLLWVWIFPIFLYGQNDTILSDDLYYDGKDLYYDGNYKKALLNFEKALSLRKEIYGNYHVQVSKAYAYLGRTYLKLRKNLSALQAFQEGLEVAQKVDKEISETVCDFYLLFGNTYSQMYQPKKSIEYYQKCIHIYEKLYGLESREIGNMYMNIGLSNIKTASYRASNRNFQKAFNVFQKSSKPKSKDFYRIYSNWGLLFRKIGEYDRALEYAQQALEIKLLHYDSTHPSVSKYYSNIGYVFEKMGNLELALFYKKKCLKNCEQSLGVDHPETGGTYGELGDTYGRLGKLDTALSFFQKAIKIQEKTLNPTHPYLVASYFDIALVYEEKGDYAKALDLYQEVYQKTISHPYLPQHLIASTQRRIAKVYFAQNDFQNALLQIRKGLKTIAPTFEVPQQEDIYSNPSLEQIEFEAETLKLLKYKSRFLQARFYKDHQQKDIEEALKTSELAIQLLDKIRRGYQSESARQFLNSRTSIIYENAIEQAFEMYRLTNKASYLYKAFQISEKSKASILWQTINEQYALETAGIPQEKLDSMRNLHYEIGALEDAVEKRAQNKHKIFKLKQDYEDLIKGLEKHNPAYYQLKYAESTTDLALLQQKIPKNKTALIEYYYTDNKLFSFVLTRQGLQGVEIDLTIDIDKKIKGLREKNIESLLLQENTTQNYIHQLNQLHELLIQPIHAAIKDIDHLIIVPHGVFQFLSFESLAPNSDQGDFRNVDYLIKKYDIQYAWSAALWAKRPQQSQRAELQFAGFALDFESKDNNSNLIASSFRESLAPLHNAIPEVMTANDYFPGKVFTNQAASESQFLSIAPQSRIIHLATHAIANDKFPAESGLMFSEEKEDRGFLNIEEIYSLKLSADLAVMSACNTGYGQLVEGEGAMSLGRAFLYAGCKSIVMSLWLANDQSTSKIMQAFYKYAAKGFTKDQALKKAKIDYLDQADALTAHPYFWANLIAVGDMSPLQTNRKGWIGLGIFFVIGITSLFWFWTTKK